MQAYYYYLLHTCVFSPCVLFFRLLGCVCVNQCPRVVSYESVELLLVQN